MLAFSDIIFPKKHKVFDQYLIPFFQSYGEKIIIVQRGQDSSGKYYFRQNYRVVFNCGAYSSFKSLFKSLGLYFFWLFICVKSKDKYVYVRNDGVAFFIAFLARKRIVYQYSHPKALLSTYKKGILNLLKFEVGKFFEVFSLKRADVVLPIKIEILDQLSIVNKRCIIDFPIPLESFRMKNKKDKKNAFVYIGSLDSNRNLLPFFYKILKTAKRLKAKLIIFSSDNLGGVSDEYQNLIEHKGWLPLDALYSEIQKYKWGIFYVDKKPQYKNSSPIKIKDYLENGLTIISNLDSVLEVDNLINNGIAYDYENPNLFDLLNDEKVMESQDFFELTKTKFEESKKFLVTQEQFREKIKLIKDCIE